MRLRLPDGFYRLDTGFACGLVSVIDGRIYKKLTAPIFVKMFRVRLYTKSGWKWTRICGGECV